MRLFALCSVALCGLSFNLQAQTIVASDDFGTFANGWTVDVNADATGGNLSITSNGTDFLIREASGSEAGDDNLGTLTKTFDTIGFESLLVDIDLRQGEGSGSFEGGEFFRVEADTGSGFSTLYEDFGVLDQGADITAAGNANISGISTGPLALNSGANNGSFDLRISFNVGFFAGNQFTESYYLENLEVSGTNVIPEPSYGFLGFFCALSVLILRRK
jgi:hypothetical protein